MSSATATTASFVTEVLATAGQLEKEDLNVKLLKLSKRIQEIKIEVYESLQKCYGEFFPNLNTTFELNNRVKNLSEELTGAANSIEREVRSQLHVSTAEFHDLSSQLEESSYILSVLEKIHTVNESLLSIDQAIEFKQYDLAVGGIKTIQILLKDTVIEKEGEIKIMAMLQRHLLEKKASLVDEVQEAWQQGVNWEFAQEEERSSDIYCEEDKKYVRLSFVSPRHILKNTIQALFGLDLLDSKLALLGDQLTKHVFLPLLEDNGIQSSTTPKTLTLVKHTENSGPVSPYDALLSVTKVMEFLYQHLSTIVVQERPSKKAEANEKEMNDDEVMSRFGKIYAGQFCLLVKKYCLAPSIPTDHMELENYGKIITLTETFEKKLASINFLIRPYDDMTEFVRNVNVLFSNKKTHEILKTARNLMTSDTHNMVTVSQETILERQISLAMEGGSAKKAETLANVEILSRSTFCIPTYKISTSVQELSKLAYKSMQEATAASSQCDVQLFYAVRNIFELFCSVVPTYHKKCLISFPLFAALHHNNCMYLAHVALTLCHQYQPLLTDTETHGTVTFVDVVPKLRRLGTDYFLLQMSAQRDQLRDYLNEMQGFGGLNESDIFTTVEKALKKVLHHLQYLSNLWREILPDTVFYKSIGTLLNSVITDIIDHIMSLDDISAEDSNLISDALSFISQDANKLFDPRPDASTNISAVSLERYILKWNKLQELQLLLKARLQEVVDRWADGNGPLAEEFSSTEVKQLIRAIFQNTEMRSAVLSAI